MSLGVAMAGRPAILPEGAARDAALDPKLVSAAHQFEASLMEELLKPLHSNSLFGYDAEGDAGESGAVGGSAATEDGSGGALMIFSSEALARALSEKGGLGIARRVMDHFEAVGESGQTLVSKPGTVGEKSKPGRGALLK